MEIDAALTSLRAMPVPASLETIDEAVLDGLSSRLIPSPLSGAIMSLAATAALGIGLAASMPPPTGAQAATTGPFGSAMALAPSTLLGAGE